jgi:hypothetical protein
MQTKKSSKLLGPASPLEVGMQFVAYYAEEEDSGALWDRFQRELLKIVPDVSHYELERARSASSMLYLKIIKRPPNVSIDSILKQLLAVSDWVPWCTLDPGADCPDIFELRKEGSLAMSSPLSAMLVTCCSLNHNTSNCRKSIGQRIKSLHNKSLFK